MPGNFHERAKIRESIALKFTERKREENIALRKNLSRLHMRYDVKDKFLSPTVAMLTRVTRDDLKRIWQLTDEEIDHVCAVIKEYDLTIKGGRK